MEIIAMNLDRTEEFLVQLAKEILSSLEENIKSIKFGSSKDEQNLCTLHLTTLLFLVKRAEYAAINPKKL
jgi:hypothetical protein